MLNYSLTRKQKRAFNCLKAGLDISRKLNKNVRFLTLTTSDHQKNNSEYSPILLNENFRKFKQIIRRTKIIYLVKQEYIKKGEKRKFYPNKKLSQFLEFDYFKIRTNEGNGVLHIIYKGDYIPYNYIVDIWQDLHNSWNIDIKRIKNKKESVYLTAGYIVSQYIANQKSSYQRSSKSWKWTIRDYYKKFNEFIVESKMRYFYNPITCRFYRRNRKYAKSQRTIDNGSVTLGLTVNIFDEWQKRLLKIIKSRKIVEMRLSDELFSTV